jgi:hypothetical protein
MATTNFRHEIIKRVLEEHLCDYCGRQRRVGDTVLVDLERGTIFCDMFCAEGDAAELGYSMPAKAETWSSEPYED